MAAPGEQVTKRPVVLALEELLNQEMPILNHGFVRVVDYMGDDSSIVQAARVSYGAGTKTVREDRSLIRYLMSNRHTTPFEMCEIKFHVKLPIFVARQWIRHRTASVNEYSARYSVLDKEFYFPAPENLALQSKENRQGRSSRVSPDMAQHVLHVMHDDAYRNYNHYLDFLGKSEGKENDAGISRELARMNLTLNTYTQLYWKIDLHNLFGFLQLRADSHAQFEIQQYAKKMMEIVKIWVPSAYEAFEEYRYGAVTLSKAEVSVMRDILQGQDKATARKLIPKRDWDRLAKDFGLE